MRAVLLAVAVAVLGGDATAAAQGRMQRIRTRGTLACGVAPGVAGFARVDDRGRYSGLDIDICRALSAAIFGAPDHVRYEHAASVEQFLRSSDVDLVSRRLTWSLQREGMGLLFGPVMFYDGQGFLVPARVPAQQVRQLSNLKLCVVAGGLSESNLTTYFRSRQLTLQKRLVQPAQLEADLSAGRCDAFTADVSELGALRSGMRKPDEFRILSEQISKEPLAQLVRAADVDLFDVLRWTIFAMIEAEELGVTSVNAAEMARRGSPDVRRLLGVVAGNGKALGLDEAWAYNVVKTVGNYGEVYERNVGRSSPLKLPRGVNALWSAGGLMFAPPLR